MTLVPRALILVLAGCEVVRPPVDDTGLETDTRDDTDTDTDSPPDTDTDHTDVVAEPSCVLGTGEEQFVAIAPGAELEVIRGPQGGWHVLGAVQCTGIVPGDFVDVLDPDNPTVTWQIVDDLSVPFGGYAGLRRPMDRPEGPGLVGEFLVLRTATYAQAVDRDATMAFELTDVGGLRVELQVQVRLVPPPGWKPVDTGASLP